MKEITISLWKINWSAAQLQHIITLWRHNLHYNKYNHHIYIHDSCVWSHRIAHFSTHKFTLFSICFFFSCTAGRRKNRQENNRDSLCVCMMCVCLNCLSMCVHWGEQRTTNQALKKESFSQRLKLVCSKQRYTQQRSDPDIYFALPFCSSSNSHLLYWRERELKDSTVYGALIRGQTWTSTC